jgi:hypothetical protein
VVVLLSDLKFASIRGKTKSCLGGGTAETIFYFATKPTKGTEIILNKEIRKSGKGRELLRTLKIAPLFFARRSCSFNFFVGDPFLRSCFSYLKSDSCNSWDLGLAKQKPRFPSPNSFQIIGNSNDATIQ